MTTHENRADYVKRKVQCWVFSKTTDEEFCLLLKTNENRGAFWQPITGTVEDEEGYFEAACRESIEETGFSFDAPPLETGHEFEFTSRFGHARERGFVLLTSGTPIPRLDAREHQDYKWVRPLEAIKMLKFSSNRVGLKKAYEKAYKKPFPIPEKDLG